MPQPEGTSYPSAAPAGDLETSFSVRSWGCSPRWSRGSDRLGAEPSTQNDVPQMGRLSARRGPEPGPRPSIRWTGVRGGADAGGERGAPPSPALGTAAQQGEPVRCAGQWRWAQVSRSAGWIVLPDHLSKPHPRHEETEARGGAAGAVHRRTEQDGVPDAQGGHCGGGRGGLWGQDGNWEQGWAGLGGEGAGAGPATGGRAEAARWGHTR